VCACATQAAATSVVVAAHTMERRDDLAEAVASALSQQPPPHEVVVAVDNNSALLDWVRGKLPDVAAVHNEGASGASATRNVGARAATGRLLAFLDDDAVAQPGWLQGLTAPLARAEVVGVGGYVAPMWLGPAPGWMPEEFLWVVGASYRGLPGAAAPVRNVWSGNMAVASADFWAVGGFREGFGKVGRVSRPEDTDLCIRLTAASQGRTWWYEPSAHVGHRVPPGRKTFGFFVRRCYNEGKGKAEMAALLGFDEGLADERRHASKTLPQGVRRELRRAVASRDFAAVQRASAIGVGLSAASLGYMLRRARPLAPAERAVSA
jgi:glycosyltransferase involved in cell wall biosynthesis